MNNEQQTNKIKKLDTFEGIILEMDVHYLPRNITICLKTYFSNLSKLYKNLT